MILIFALIAILSLAIPRLFTQLYASSRIFTIENSPSERVAIVFGAGLRRDGTPTTVLKDRVTTAVELYKAGKVEKLLMSGDNRFVDYNEPASMFAFATELGVPEGDIVLDYAGRRSYDTCYRALHIFDVKSAILVTQNFHLPRALFICNQLGLPSIGVIADRQTYTRSARSVWFIRELPATFMAMLDVWITHPLPVLGNQEPIFPDSQFSENKNQ